MVANVAIQQGVILLLWARRMLLWFSAFCQAGQGSQFGFTLISGQICSLILTWDIWYLCWEVWRQWWDLRHLWSIRSAIIPEGSYTQEETGESGSNFLLHNVFHAFRQVTIKSCFSMLIQRMNWQNISHKRLLRACRAKWNLGGGSIWLWMQGKQERCVVAEEWPKKSWHEDRLACLWRYSQKCDGNQDTSPDTDVFILSLRWYSDLCQNTAFVTDKGQNNCEINTTSLSCLDRSR